MTRDERIAELLAPHLASFTDADIKVVRCLMEDAYGWGMSDANLATIETVQKLKQDLQQLMESHKTSQQRIATGYVSAAEALAIRGVNRG